MVDHNHSTGKIRALLCSNCNTAIGLLKEDIPRVERLIEYLKLHYIPGGGVVPSENRGIM